jgi:hypothetical protein
MTAIVPFRLSESKLYLLTDHQSTPHGFYDSVPEARSAATHLNLVDWQIWLDGAVVHSSDSHSVIDCAHPTSKAA